MCLRPKTSTATKEKQMIFTGSFFRTALLASSLFLSSQATMVAAADITILNNDAVGEGFNDTTDTSTPSARTAYGSPLPSIADNPGATLGQMRLNVFQAAADYWESQLNISVEIEVRAQLDPLTCTSNSATLGSAGANIYFRDFSGAPRAGTFYTGALTNQLFGANADGNHEINATFNSDIDKNSNCLPFDWWYGIGEPEASNTIGLYVVVLHEIAHGLGFADAVGTDGSKLVGFDDAYMVQLRDFATNKQWPDMSNVERSNTAGNAQVSGTSDTQGQLWTGKNVRDISADVFTNSNLTAGARAGGCMDVYVPTVHSGGSSVSHFDTGTTEIGSGVSELMEPFATSSPSVLGTLALLADIGYDLTPAGAAAIAAASPGYTESAPHLSGSTGDATCDNNLTLVIAAASVSEGAGTAATTATVSRNTDTTSALVVSLSSSDTTEATVQSSVTIAAGQTTSPTFNLNTVDDAIVDGTQTVTITASATAHTNGTDSLDVTDDDAAGLTLAISAASVR